MHNGEAVGAVEHPEAALGGVEGGSDVAGPRQCPPEDVTDCQLGIGLCDG
jgi:hypothetical protein